MPNNNEKETMTQAFSCEDGPESLKTKVPSKKSKKFLPKSLKSSF